MLLARYLERIWYNILALLFRLFTISVIRRLLPNSPIQ